MEPGCIQLHTDWAEEPKPSLNCPRQNGYFGHKDANVCDTFYYCVDGMFNMITCPGGLVFNPKTGICTWPDEAQKKGCSSEGEFIYTILALPLETFRVHYFSAPNNAYSSLNSRTLFVSSESRIVQIHLPESWRKRWSYASTLCRSRWLPILLCVH